MCLTNGVDDPFSHYKVEHFVKSEAWGGDYDRQLILSEMIHEDVHCKPNERKNVVCQTDRKGRSQPFFCHIQGQDIVVPPSILERPVNVDCHHCIGQDMGKALDMAWRIPYLDKKAANIAKARGNLNCSTTEEVICMTKAIIQ